MELAEEKLEINLERAWKMPPGRRSLGVVTFPVGRFFSSGQGASLAGAFLMILVVLW